MQTLTIPVVTVANIPAGTTLPARGFFVVRGRNFALPTVGCSGASNFADGVALPDVLSLSLIFNPVCPRRAALYTGDS